MGFVDDDSDSEAEGNSLKPQANEEANLANGKDSPFPDHRILSPSDPRAPTTENNDLLSITPLRRKGITESEEIWEELEDDALAELSPSSRRRNSARSTPSKLHSRAQPIEENTNDSTALLARSDTGRTYRDRKRRRSTPMRETRHRERARRSASSQEALGSLWKVKNWWRGNDRMDKGKNTGNGNRDEIDDVS